MNIFKTDETVNDWLANRRLLVKGKATAVLFTEMSIDADKKPSGSKEIKLPRYFNGQKYIDDIKGVFAENAIDALDEDEKRKAAKEIALFTNIVKINADNKAAVVNICDVYDIVSDANFFTNELLRIQSFLRKLRKEVRR